MSVEATIAKKDRTVGGTIAQADRTVAGTLYQKPRLVEYGQGGGGPTYDPLTTAYLAYCTAQGYTAASGSVLTAMDTMFVTWRTEGIISLLDAAWVFATNGDQDAACINVINPGSHDCTRVNSPTFTSLQGLQGDGANAYLNPSFNLLSDGQNYSLNQCSIGAYIRQVSSTANSAIMAAQDIGADFKSTQISYLTSSEFLGRINNANTNSTRYSSGGSGLIHSNRDDATSQTLYFNGVSVDTDSDSAQNINRSILLLAGNQNGSVVGHSDAQLSFAFIGGDISGKATELYNSIQTYMTALGTQV
ncbi:MAG: hypothetical protein NXI20_17875 [bacterium]|nr:hypothetical protein [bacterium]